MPDLCCPCRCSRPAALKPAPAYTPADKDPLIAAMEAAGYTYDGLESTNDNLRFFGEGGQVIIMGGWHECEEWLNGVVFDDPQVMNRVEIILHPERFPEKDPGRPEADHL